VIVKIFTSALAGACQSAQSGPRAQSSSPLGVAPNAGASASAQAASLPDPFGSLRARGTLHAEPIKVPATARFRERWLVFLGTKDMARSAWLFTPRGEGVAEELRPLENWPAGVRVAGHVARGGVVYLLLETVALLDQPAGLRAVRVECLGQPCPLQASPGAFQGVADLSELAKRLDAADPVARAGEPPEGALMAVLKAAGKDEAALGAALAREGCDVYDVWQSTFSQRADHLEPQKLATSQRGQDLLAMVQAAYKNDHCQADACEAPSPRGTASVRLVEQGGKWVIRAVEQEVAAARAPYSLAPHAVAPSASTALTEQALRESVRTIRQVLGEAPLGSLPSLDRRAEGGGPAPTIGIAVTDLESESSPTLVVRDGAYVRVFPLSSMGLFAARNAGASFEARFADVDGDGRTDVVLRASGRAADSSSQVLTRVFLAPGPSVQVEEAQVDVGSELALLGAANVDDAVQAAIGVPTRGVSAPEACALLKGANNLASFSRITLGGARVLSFDESEMPTYRARVVPGARGSGDEAKLSEADVKPLGERCPDLDCSATRPFCTSSDGYSEYYWFGWQNNLLKLAGAAFHAGN